MATRQKYGGKTKGSKNIATKVNQAFWQDIIDGEEANIRIALANVYKINAAEYLKIMISITEFVMPKLARVDGTPTDTNQTRLIRKKADD